MSSNGSKFKLDNIISSKWLIIVNIVGVTLANLFTTNISIFTNLLFWIAISFFSLRGKISGIIGITRPFYIGIGSAFTTFMLGFIFSGILVLIGKYLRKIPFISRIIDKIKNNIEDKDILEKDDKLSNITITYRTLIATVICYCLIVLMSYLLIHLKWINIDGIESNFTGFFKIMIPTNLINVYHQLISDDKFIEFVSLPNQIGLYIKLASIICILLANTLGSYIVIDNVDSNSSVEEFIFGILKYLFIFFGLFYGFGMLAWNISKSYLKIETKIQESDKLLTDIQNPQSNIEVTKDIMSRALGDSNIQQEMPTSVSGEAVSGEAVSGEVVSGEAVSGEVVSGEAVSGEVVSGEAVSGEVVSGEVVSGEAVSGEAAETKFEQPLKGGYNIISKLDEIAHNASPLTKSMKLNLQKAKGGSQKALYKFLEEINRREI